MLSNIKNRIIHFVRQKEIKPALKIPVDDPEEVNLRVNFYREFVKQNDLVFDVGANVGNRISPMLKIGARVVAVEPQDYCREILQAKFGSSIEIVSKGLGEKEEVKDFYISDANTISSFSKEWIDAVKKDRFKEHHWHTVSQIQLTTLDQLIQKFGLPVFIKIDVEGYELEVLKGLTQTIPCISYEYTTPEQTTRAIECMNLLASISSRIECNYSIGESMNLEMDEWKSAEKMKDIINSDSFIASGFGDIYIRSYNY